MSEFGRLKVGVIGTGRLGRQHARVYHELAEADLVGVTDSAPGRAEEVAQEFSCRAYKSSDALLRDVEAVSIAVPTPYHHREGVGALRSGVHLLVEKPIASTLAEADELIDTARNAGVVLQTGHVERFGGALQAAFGIAHAPRFIECHRLAGFSPRGSDVAVVLDLMIHDVDIALHLVQDEVVRVDAIGIPVLTTYTDIANARIEFRNGAIANLTASRVSRERMRKIRFFQATAYVSIDCLAGAADVYRTCSADGGAPGDIKIEHERLTGGSHEPLKAELASFVECVRDGTEPVVSGAVARKALDVALQILQDIERRRETFPNPVS